jgi:ATP-dependent helicase/nuclease subunit A
MPAAATISPLTRQPDTGRRPQALIRAALGLLPHENEAALIETAWPLEALPVDYIRAVFEFAGSAKSASKAYNFSLRIAGRRLRARCKATAELLREVFFTKSGTPAKLGGVASKTVHDRFPDLADRVARPRPR